MSFSDQLRQCLDRLEIVARGEEMTRAEACRALTEGRPNDARALALEVLEGMPRSPVALALWADAALLLMLDHEVIEATERLAVEIPFRADVWIRLGAARARLGGDPFPDYERAVEVGDPRDAADHARLCLADHDLGALDPDRAERWLDAIGLARRGSQAVLQRRVEARLDRGDEAEARALATSLAEPGPGDASGWLVRARLLAAEKDPAAARAFERALVLGAPRADDLVSAYVSSTADVLVVARIREIATSLGRADEPIWRAAFARAEHRPRDALHALAEGARSRSDHRTRRAYLDAAVEERDARALAEALGLGTDVAKDERASLEVLLVALGSEDLAQRIALLDGAQGPAASWAGELREAACLDLCGQSGVMWRGVLAELSRRARALFAIDVLGAIEGIAVDLERPVRVAVIGEFNAGKSTFINALLGEGVLPVGILPTTATVNHVVWAPDRIARIERREAPDRLVPLEDVRRTLAEVGVASVLRVVIHAPLEALRRVEIVDTPGFNAPNADHADAARDAIWDAHAAIWLLDVNQPLKETERALMVDLRSAAVPLLVLANKADRLTEDEVCASVRHIDDGLRAAQIDVLAPTVAFSAKLALEGAPAQVAGFSRALELLESAIIGQSGELRDRVLRARAGALATDLAARARTASASALALQDHARGLCEWAARAATLLESVRDELVHDCERAVLGAIETARADLRPAIPMLRAREVFTGSKRAERSATRKGRRGLSDPAAWRFIVDRLRVPVTRALVGAVRDRLGPKPEFEARLEPRIGAMVTFVAGDLAGRESSEAAFAARVVDEVRVTLREMASARVEVVPIPPHAEALEALGRALEPKR